MLPLSRCMLEIQTQIPTSLRAKFVWNVKSLANIGLIPSKSLDPLSLTPLNASSMPSSRVFKANQQFASKFYSFLPAAVSSKTSYALGPGLDNNDAGIAGVPSNFTVYSVDEYGNPRLNGGDMWTAVLSQHCKHYPSKATLYGHFTNLQNGSYYVEYMPTVSGRYWLSIITANANDVATTVMPVSQIMASPLNIMSSPFSILILSGKVSIANSQIVGNIYNTVSGFSSFFLLLVRDVFGNYASGEQPSTWFLWAQLRHPLALSRATSLRPTSRHLHRQRYNPRRRTAELQAVRAHNVLFVRFSNFLSMYDDVGISGRLQTPSVEPPYISEFQITLMSLNPSTAPFRCQRLICRFRDLTRRILVRVDASKHGRLLCISSHSCDQPPQYTWYTHLPGCAVAFPCRFCIKMLM